MTITSGRGKINAITNQKASFGGFFLSLYQWYDASVTTCPARSEPLLSNIP